ncbi:hypothetical protein P872_02840 [Rhodonellum psychrophilum GCM71 = DSM 17998]|uniref:Uncharacterized protein n=1 Tax=Rhodonellum psychrophilum GCM71 = DSM 17998 TaxID=1123057 RepID=U5BSJ2_9BACT|nr:hypothetical protein P872_02840 [Rhodonellum psychrophilum GCM71 = DSM 17998]
MKPSIGKVDVSFFFKKTIFQESEIIKQPLLEKLPEKGFLRPIFSSED